MPRRYQDIYPEAPLLDSSESSRAVAGSLLTLEYFEAAPAEMPREVFAQHHVVLNLREESTRVENWRDGEHRDFELHPFEIIVTPAGMESGWRWYETSKVIIITLEPKQLERFAQVEVGVLLTERQLTDLPQFNDPDICQAGILLKNALETKDIGSEIMFESMARVFLVKLIQKYGERQADYEFTKSFTARHYKRVLDYIAGHYSQSLTLEELASEATLSPSHFSRLFKQTIGSSPMQFLTSYRVEQAKRMLAERNRPLLDIALGCGFSDQAHFSRVFKQITNSSPNAFRSSLKG